MRCQGTAFTMTRGPAAWSRAAPTSCSSCSRPKARWTPTAPDGAGVVEAGDVAIVDYARPFHSAATDYANLMIVIARESVPAALLALEPHGLIFPRGSGAARLIGAAMQEFYAQADHLTVSEAEAAIEGIVALTTACARARLAGDEADHVKSRRKAALDYIDAHLGNAQLGPDEIAEAAQPLARVALPAVGGGRRHSRRVVEAPARRGPAAHAGRQQGRALAEGNRQALRLRRHEPVQPGVPRALRRAAAAVPRARPPAGPRLARSAARWPTASTRTPCYGGNRG